MGCFHQGWDWHFKCWQFCSLVLVSRRWWGWKRSCVCMWTYGCSSGVGHEELSLTPELFLLLPFLCLHSPHPLYYLPWQEEVSQCAQGLKNTRRIGSVSAFLYIFPFFLAVYSARHTGSYYIKMLFLVINPMCGGFWQPRNLLFSLVNSHLLACTDLL